MAEPMQKAASAHTGRNNPGINSPPKRRPPKLRRNFSSVVEPSGKDAESTKDPDPRHVSPDTNGDVTSTGNVSTVDDEYVSEQESVTPETEPRGGG
jgi:hypothetical protein